MSDRTFRILLAALILVIPGLAYFQYSMLGRIGEGELAIMRTNLRASGAAFAADFRGVTRQLHETFQIPANPSDERTAVMLDSCWSEWNRQGLPKLLKSIYFIRYVPPVRPQLYRIPDHRSLLEETEWTPQIRRVRDIMEYQTRGSSDSNRVVLFRTSFSDYYPFVVINCSPTKVLLDLPSRQPQLNYVVLELDNDYVKNEWIPNMLRRHFTGSEDYHMSLHSRSRGVDFYRTDSVSAEPDVTVEVPDIAASGVFVMSVVEKTSATGRNIEARMEQRLGDAQMKFSHPQPDARADMELRMTHRSGSLENAVQVSRRNNLIVSGIILTFLGLSFAALILAIRRKEKLSEQQMEFVAGITHELRTPLAVIRSAAENIADGVVKDEEKLKEYGILIRSQGAALGDMVEQILDYSGIQSGKSGGTRETIELPELIRSEIHEASVTHSDFQIDFSSVPESAVVHGDRNELRSVFRNLINNAIKYSGNSRLINIHCTCENGYAKLSIRDFGIGISPDEKERIFEPFFRGLAVREAQIHGNGLGLALVKRIIESHGGRTDVTSTPGEGSAFTVILPLQNEKNTAH